MSNINLVLICDAEDIFDDISVDLTDWWTSLSVESFDDQMEAIKNLSYGDHYYLDNYDVIFLGFRGQNPRFKIIVH